MEDHKHENGTDGCLIDFDEIKIQSSNHVTDVDSLIGDVHQIEKKMENGATSPGYDCATSVVDQFDPLSIEVPPMTLQDKIQVTNLDMTFTNETRDSSKPGFEVVEKSHDNETPELTTPEIFTPGLSTSVTLVQPSGAPGSPVKNKPPVSSPTKVPKLIPTNGEKGQVSRPKSGTNKVKAATPTYNLPTGIPGCQRAVSMDRSKSSLSSPKTPSNTPVGTVDFLKLKSPADDCGGSTASTPRSSTSQTRIKSKIGSLDNNKHVAGGGNISIMSQKVDYSQVTSKCGSKDLIKHTPKGGDKKIECRKLDWKAESKVGSLNNAKHKPGGGIKKIESAKLEWKAASKIGSLDNSQHVAGGGTKKIENLKLDFKEKANSKVGSKDNMAHRPGGGTKKIESQKLNFKETAQPRVDASLKTSVKIEDVVSIQ